MGVRFSRWVLTQTVANFFGPEIGLFLFGSDSITMIQITDFKQKC